MLVALTRSKSLWFASLVLCGIAAAFVTGGGSILGLPFSFLALPAVVAAVGILLEKLWAARLAYAVLLVVTLGWCAVVYQLAGPSWPYPGTAETVLSLIPGVSLLVGCLALMVLIFRFFRTVG
jgi:hypothetical protein